MLAFPVIRVIPEASTVCGYRIMAITSAFQADDAGSIPATRSPVKLMSHSFIISTGEFSLRIWLRTLYFLHSVMPGRLQFQCCVFYIVNGMRYQNESSPVPGPTIRQNCGCRLTTHSDTDNSIQVILLNSCMMNALARLMTGIFLSIHRVRTGGPFSHLCPAHTTSENTR